MQEYIKKILVPGPTTLLKSNNEMEVIMKIIIYFGNSGHNLLKKVS